MGALFSWVTIMLSGAFGLNCNQGRFASAAMGQQKHLTTLVRGSGSTKTPEKYLTITITTTKIITISTVIIVMRFLVTCNHKPAPFPHSTVQWEEFCSTRCLFLQITTLNNCTSTVLCLGGSDPDPTNWQSSAPVLTFNLIIVAISDHSHHYFK